MEINKAKSAIEAILFAMGDSVEISKIADVLEISEKEVKNIVTQMNFDYEKEDRGIYISMFEDSYQLSTKPELYDYLIKIAKAPRKYVLSDTLLETLSIIAYKQPITKLEIEKIRGVSCDHAVNRLVEFSLVQELGRLDAPGRPLLFGTTEEFLRTFGVKSINELPVINAEKIDDFKHEAEEEIQLKLDI